MAQIHLYLFGVPHCEQDGRLVRIARRKTTALWAYLAVNRKAQSREVLAALLWPEDDPGSARANLRREIARVKEVIGGDCLDVDRSVAGIAESCQLWVDVQAFCSRIEQARRHGHALAGERAVSPCPDCMPLLAEAVDLYTADFLEGFNLPDSLEFEEWQFFEKESLRRALAEALQQLVAWLAGQAAFEQAIGYTRRWLALDNLHEPAQRWLMRLYAWAGQPSAALRQYQEYARLLKEELEAIPEPETTSLYQAIHARQLAPPDVERGVPVGSHEPEERFLRKDPRPVEDVADMYPQSEVLQQEIRFCTSLDGVRIAYAVSGSGPVLVKAANWLSHLEFDWNSPIWRHWLRYLSTHNTLIRYDERGCGLSDWNTSDLSFDAWVRDLEAVVEASGLERFPLLGISQGGPIAIAYTVRHPEKVSRLVLYGSYTRGRGNRPLTSQQREERDVMIRMVKIGWGQEHPAFRQVFTTLFLPDGTPEQIRDFNELQRISTSPEIAAQILQGFDRIDVRDLAAQVKVPALVLHAQGDLRVPFEEGRLLASLLPDARFVPLQSRSHILLESEPAWKKFMNEVTNFLEARVADS